jgi:hypothetical protein
MKFVASSAIEVETAFGLGLGEVRMVEASK